MHDLSACRLNAQVPHLKTAHIFECLQKEKSQTDSHGFFNSAIHPQILPGELS